MPKLVRDNFSIAEMTECSFAQRLGIDNTPDLETFENLGRTVTGLEQIREILGYPMHVSSGYRCRELERVLCTGDFQAWCSCVHQTPGVDAWQQYLSEKAHPRGYAADFTCAQFGSSQEVFHEILASKVPFDQCFLEGSWIHVSFDPRMRHMTGIKTFNDSGIANFKRHTASAPQEPGR